MSFPYLTVYLRTLQKEEYSLTLCEPTREGLERAIEAVSNKIVFPSTVGSIFVRAPYDDQGEALEATFVAEEPELSPAETVSHLWAEMEGFRY